MKYGLYSLQSKINFKTFDYMIVNYSVDMVRLKFDVTFPNSWMKLDNAFYNLRVLYNADISDFVTSRYMAYHRLCVVKDDADSVIKIGCRFNDEKSTGETMGFVEFNPNKVNMKHFDILLKTICIMCCGKVCSDDGILTLSRWDLAIDIPVTRNEVLMYKDRKEYQLILGKGTKTEYLGQRNTNGFVKLYDKTKESKLDEIITRLEVTIDGDDLPPFPEVCLAPKQLELSIGLNDTEAVLVELLNRVEESERCAYIKRLGRYMQRKVKPFCVGRDILEYDYAIVNQMLDALRSLECGRIVYLNGPCEANYKMGYPLPDMNNLPWL